jgi:hypothetical protein
MASRTKGSTLITEGWYQTSLYRADLRSDDDGRFLSLVNNRTGCVEGEGLNEIMIREAIDVQTAQLQNMLDDHKCKLS